MTAKVVSIGDGGFSDQKRENKSYPHGTGAVLGMAIHGNISMLAKSRTEAA